MEITDIIGKGKILEPPFSPHSVESPYIVDTNRKIVASIDYAAVEHLNHPTRQSIRASLARHICDLLNREHCKKGGAK